MKPRTVPKATPEEVARARAAKGTPAKKRAAASPPPPPPRLERAELDVLPGPRHDSRAARIRALADRYYRESLERTPE